MKQLREWLLPPGWGASPSQDYPQQYVAGTHNTPLQRGTAWSKVSCLRKQHRARDQASIPQPSDLKFNALTTNRPHPHATLQSYTKVLDSKYCLFNIVCLLFCRLSVKQSLLHCITCSWYHFLGWLLKGSSSISCLSRFSAARLAQEGTGLCFYSAAGVSLLLHLPSTQTKGHFEFQSARGRVTKDKALRPIPLPASKIFQEGHNLIC